MEEFSAGDGTHGDGQAGQHANLSTQLKFHLKLMIGCLGPSAVSAAQNDYWAGQTRIQKQAAMAWIMFSEGRRDAAIEAMRKAADLDDASEKNVAMENKLVPIRALLGELYLAAGMNKEALAEFEASDKVMPNRFGIIAGAGAAARASGSVEVAKRYYRALTVLAAAGDGDRPEVAEARTYLVQN